MAKILIIDDDPDIVEGMRVVLESKGYEVKHASNGETGLQAVTSENPDMVILDVMMETSDSGFEVARAIKKDHKNMPILMITAIKEKMGLDFSTEAGDSQWLPVDAYLEKPLKPHELINKVEKFIKKK